LLPFPSTRPLIVASSPAVAFARDETLVQLLGDQALTPPYTYLRRPTALLLIRNQDRGRWGKIGEDAGR